ncbi:TPA: fimbria/pilus periplasmic chaperone [Klebsiella aerogenes]|nr:fimbria/pilus periplasmic chaperone [Klebsiella aerogenes]
MHALTTRILLLSVLTGCVISSSASMAKTRIDPHTKSFEMRLGASRIIYHPERSGESLTVSNAQDYPILVQGKVLAEDKKSPAPFIVTPPVFRLEARQQSRLRIIHTGKPEAADRETLQWMCVTGIPPKDTDVWALDNSGKTTAPADTATLHIEISAHQCIKLIVRPSGLEGSMAEAAAGLHWHLEGRSLTVTNPSAYYINLQSVLIDGKPVPAVSYLAPHASGHYPLPAGRGGKVTWRYITDEGGESRELHAPIQS